MRKLFRFGRSPSRAPAPADSRDPNRVSLSRTPPTHASSSHPSLKPEPPQDGNPTATLPSGVLLGGPTFQPDHASLPFTTRAIPEDPHLASMSGLSSPISHSPSCAPPQTNALSEHRDLLAVAQHCQEATAGLQQSLLSPALMSVYDSRNVSVSGNMNMVNYVGGGNNNFMKILLQGTIPGAAFDSSARDPPPRCHPETRLAVLEQCVTFIVTCHDERKMRWVFGAAGVGKSAIMQSVAERPLPPVTLCASIFFFVHGRSDGSKAIITLAYQLAVRCKPYRVFIERELDDDPSLLQKAMSVQFNKLIVEPFIHYPPLKSVGRILIIIDGLDECDNQRTQEELLRLISDLCITIPSSPFVWLIASRPEPHIMSFFAQSAVYPTYEKEEILVDSDEARKDVEKFLLSELSKVQAKFSLNPRVRWPSDEDFWKLAGASGGLFVYAQTVTKYIGDPHAGNPKSQLDDVLRVIDAHPLLRVTREHPMALLDALYAQILSKVPLEARSNMRKLLLALVVFWETIYQPNGETFIILCNWLGITSGDAYAALRHLFSVLKVPQRDGAHREALTYFHKSFIDYIRDFARSGFSPDIEQEAQQLNAECAFRVLRQAPDNLHLGDVDAFVWSVDEIGRLVDGTGSRCDIALTWSADDAMAWDDNRTRVYMYEMAIAAIVEGVRNRQEAFYNTFCIRLLTTCFYELEQYGGQNLHQVVFDKSRCHGFMEQGLVKRVPVEALNFSDLMWKVELRFNRPITSSIDLPDPWSPFCDHEREGEWGQDKPQAWTTKFGVDHDVDSDDDENCNCYKRLKRQLLNWQTTVPDHPALVLFTTAGLGFVEFKFVDGEDGVSEWRYWLVHKFTGEKRRELGSTV